MIFLYLAKLLPLGGKGPIKPLAFASTPFFTHVSYHFFSKTTDKLFLKFCMEAEDLKYQNLSRPDFSEKFSFWAKIQKIVAMS